MVEAHSLALCIGNKFLIIIHFRNCLLTLGFPLCRPPRGLLFLMCAHVFVRNVQQVYRRLRPSTKHTHSLEQRFQSAPAFVVACCCHNLFVNSAFKWHAWYYYFRSRSSRTAFGSAEPLDSLQALWWGGVTAEAYRLWCATSAYIICTYITCAERHWNYTFEVTTRRCYGCLFYVSKHAKTGRQNYSTDTNSIKLSILVRSRTEVNFTEDLKSRPLW